MALEGLPRELKSASRWSKTSSQGVVDANFGAIGVPREIKNRAPASAWCKFCLLLRFLYSESKFYGLLSFRSRNMTRDGSKMALEGRKTRSRWPQEGPKRPPRRLPNRKLFGHPGLIFKST